MEIHGHSAIRSHPARPRALTAFLATAFVLGAFAASSVRAGSPTQTITGAADGAVNNLPPAVDTLKANPRTVVLGSNGHGDEVRVSGTVHDDNGHWDVGSVTLKVTRPGGTSTVLPATLTPSAEDVTVLSFSATHSVAAGDETGTYQVDGFATDLAGAQSPVRSATFRVVAQHQGQAAPSSSTRAPLAERAKRPTASPTRLAPAPTSTSTSVPSPARSVGCRPWATQPSSLAPAARTAGSRRRQAGPMWKAPWTSAPWARAGSCWSSWTCAVPRSAAPAPALPISASTSPESSHSRVEFR